MRPRDIISTFRVRYLCRYILPIFTSGKDKFRVEYFGELDLHMYINFKLRGKLKTEGSGFLKKPGHIALNWSIQEDVLNFLGEYRLCCL